MLQKIKEYERFQLKDKLVITYNESGKLAYQSVFGGGRYITIFNYPKQLRLFHLWLLGIFKYSKQHVPFNNNESFYAA